MRPARSKAFQACPRQDLYLPGFIFNQQKINMRLTDDQIQAIKQTAHVVLGDDARVILFGSRTDDAKKGGDIDLLFETDQAVDNRATTIGALYASLIRKLGDRKIDVILKDAATPESPVLVIARQTGIQL